MILESFFTQAVKYIDPQIRLAEKAGKQKKEYKLSMISEKTLEKVTELAATRIESVFTDPSYGKVRASLNVYPDIKFDFQYSLIILYIQFERGEALDNIGKDVRKVFEEEGDQESLSILPKAVDTVRKKVSLVNQYLEIYFVSVFSCSGRSSSEKLDLNISA